jgi:hypothetical protein
MTASRLRCISPGLLAHAFICVVLVGCAVENSSNQGVPANGGSSGVGGAGSAGSGGVSSTQCASVSPGRAQVRRLTHFEYDNVVADLLGDTTAPSNRLPPDTIQIDGAPNVFGNDAALLSVSSDLVDQWGKAAADIAARATATPTELAKLAPCAGAAAPDDSCTSTVITTLLSRAYHRDAIQADIDGYLALEKGVQAIDGYASGIAAVIEGILQAPEYLYRIELGKPAPDQPQLRKPTADETAARLSFLYWGTVPDDELRMAAKSGQLDAPEGIKTQATRLLNDNRSKAVVRYFFDYLLELKSLDALQRTASLYPGYSQAIGPLLHEETQQFLQHLVFDADGPGTWASALTAPYTYVNDQLATYYGISGVTGGDFRKMPLPDTTKRLGLLTQAGLLATTITTDTPNPVKRGGFIINRLLCMNLKLPTDPKILAQVKIPDPTSGKTARERFTNHRSQDLCKGCHAIIDPVGFTLENYDEVGQWRDQENGETIDASGAVPSSGLPSGADGTVSGPIELVKKLATTDVARDCLAQYLMDFGYGKTIDAGDACTQTSLNEKFKQSGGNVKQLLIDLSQTDDFLYLPAKD